jgi:osmoprotectant transport system permease protein
MKFFILVFLPLQFAIAKPLVIGSKKFTESVILGEVIRLGLESEDQKAEHKKEIGGTRILWSALLNGDIDLYPEYSGTIQEEILQSRTADISELRILLKKQGIGISDSLGFNNTYALGMLQSRAQELGIKTISDLSRHENLIFGWASEFMERKDGWPGLQSTYQLGQTKIQGLDHDVGYRALERGEIDVIDLYSTDAEIPYYKILTLEDDRKFFPRYDAVILYRLNKAEKLSSLLQQLQGSISGSEMSGMNKRVKVDKLSSSAVAAEFLNLKFSKSVSVVKETLSKRILQRSIEHFRLVGVSLILAILAGVPLGVISSKSRSLGNLILGIVSTIQTIPTLALLVMLIKPLSMLGLSGIGDTPAFIALFLYSLLPIVRNTHSGMTQISPSLKETALVLGLSPKTRLLKIELPLSLPLILAGIKTALVLNIGFATLGALVGAGGYGQSILTGIRLDDYGLILEGAVPAALLAIVAQKFFDALETKIVSPGLR